MTLDEIVAANRRRIARLMRIQRMLVLVLIGNLGLQLGLWFYCGNLWYVLFAAACAIGGVWNERSAARSLRSIELAERKLND